MGFVLKIIESAISCSSCKIKICRVIKNIFSKIKFILKFDEYLSHFLQYRQSIGIPCISITILSGTHVTTADFGWEALEIEIVTKENLKLSLCGLH